MKLKDFNLLIVMCLLTLNIIAQTKVSGFVNNEETNSPINDIEIFSKESGKLTTSKTRSSLRRTFRGTNKDT